jgi:hypothetical protein
LRWQNAWFLALTLMLGAASWTHAERVERFATRDTTLYEDASGAFSNGAGEILLVGRIGSTGEVSTKPSRTASGMPVSVGTSTTTGSWTNSTWTCFAHF